MVTSSLVASAMHSVFSLYFILSISSLCNKTIKLYQDVGFLYNYLELICYCKRYWTCRRYDKFETTSISSNTKSYIKPLTTEHSILKLSSLKNTSSIYYWCSSMNFRILCSVVSGLILVQALCLFRKCRHT